VVIGATSQVGTLRAETGDMRLACSLLLVTGCGLSSEQPAPDVYARDCIQTIDRGPTLYNGPLAIVLTSACTDTSMIDNVQLYDGVLESVTGFLAPGQRYRGTRIAEIDGTGSIDTIGLTDSASAYVAWIGATLAMPTRVDYARPFDDLAVADLDHDQKPDVIVAGDDAIRVALGTGTLRTTIATTDEQVLLSGKPFKNLARSIKGDLFYLAQAPGGTSVELGVARASASAPLAFTATTLGTDAAGLTRSLAIADVDGDGLADAIGQASRLFVFSSRTQTVSFLDETALAISTGDLDADGVDDAAFLAADGTSVRRIRIAADGSLTAEHVLDVHGQTLTVGDFDSNGIADVAVVDRLGRTGSTVSLYRF